MNQPVISIVSNGHGEDYIGSNLAKALIKQIPNSHIQLFPLVGSGLAYEQAGFEPGFKNTPFPSGGFVRNIRSIAGDFKSGLGSTLWRQRKTLCSAIQNSDLVIVVGDVFCLGMSKFRLSTPCFFLPTAKSDRFMKHSLIEYRLMKRWCQTIFPRDHLTTDSFLTHGLPAKWVGNPMMEGLERARNAQASDIGLLPGSREEAYENLFLQLKIVEEIARERPSLKFKIGWPLQLSIDTLEKETEKWGWAVDQNQLVKGSIEIPLVLDFVAFLKSCRVIIGLAGTANEQAAHVGKTVIAFEGSGSQSTLKRFLEQKKLLDDQLIVVDSHDPLKISKIVLESWDTWCFSDHQESESASKRISLAVIDFLKYNRPKFDYSLF